MPTQTNYHPITGQLQQLIAENNWGDKFETAIRTANSKNVPILGAITSLDKYLAWIDAFLYWVPNENAKGQNVEEHLNAFYFIADQAPLLALQNKLAPFDKMRPLTPFSKWLVDYANEMGLFLDEPGSLTPETEQSFYESPIYNMKEYTRPRGGWKSFNQFFARHFKPGFRPIAAVSDQSIIISPADSTFAGQWEIRSDSNVTVKGMNWKISELLDGSPYKDRFENGLLMHSYLSPTDYHRQHAPVGGRVLEARVVQGQVYLEVVAKEQPQNPEGHSLSLKRDFESEDNLGYQFAQTRGLIVLDTPIGLMAVLPIGMCQVSSVVLTAEVGTVLRKGEELSYFQFGGSDIVMVFEASSNISFTAQPGVHYKMGTKLGQAYPVI